MSDGFEEFWKYLDIGDLPFYEYDKIKLRIAWKASEAATLKRVREIIDYELDFCPIGQVEVRRVLLIIKKRLGL